MFADEARFGRMNRPRPCWAPTGMRPRVASQLIREYTYLYGAVCPKDGACVFLIMPASDTECFQIFLDILAKKFSGQHILLFVDGAPNHHCDDLVIPAKPQWEFPRLCRGGSKSLTYPAVDTVGPSTKLRIVSSQAYEEEFHRWMTMKA